MNAHPCIAWRRSARSIENGSCVEVAMLAPQIATRDSKHPDGGMLIMDQDAWRGFLVQVTTGSFD